jgi:hypothetical protein
MPSQHIDAVTCTCNACSAVRSISDIFAGAGLNPGEEAQVIAAHFVGIYIRLAQADGDSGRSQALLEDFTEGVERTALFYLTQTDGEA